MPIVQVALEYDGEVACADEERPDLSGPRFGGSPGLITVAAAAVVLALLPAAVGLAILLGTTVPLGFGAAAGLTILAGVKFAAVAGGLLAAIPRRLGRTSGFD